ncbi:MAG: MlaD family protein [Planctomycetota bacterium]|nr:MlaD family protein [Planctomycetota bacterium]
MSEPEEGRREGEVKDEKHRRAGIDLPVAELKRERRVSLAWLVPLIALLLAAWLGYWAWRERGLLISVQLPDGHGLRVGDPVRYRGITVGEIRAAELTDDGERIVVTASLHAKADRLARAGTRFWIVRPELRLTGIEGLETLIGPRYLAALPGEGTGRRQRTFIGLPQPPVVESIQPGDLEIILEAPRRGSLRPGAPVTYRQVRIGTILSVGLASDGSIVEARGHIEKAYRQLVRAETRFWDAGGVEAALGISGLSLELESLEEVITGGVALAVPPPERAGDVVHTGHRFTLHTQPDDDWLDWQPTVAVGSSLLPPGCPLPEPLRAAIGWKQGFLFKGRRLRQGWVLQTADGLLGPADLLIPDEKADRQTTSLEVAGQVVALEQTPAREQGGLARLDLMLSESIWPADRMRVSGEPEDCIAVADPKVAPIPLAAPRLTAEAGRWRIDPAVSVDDSWHGACVLSRTDGALVGILLVEDEHVSVALLPG